VFCIYSKILLFCPFLKTYTHIFNFPLGSESSSFSSFSQFPEFYELELAAPSHAPNSLPIPRTTTNPQLTLIALSPLLLFNSSSFPTFSSSHFRFFSWSVLSLAHLIFNLPFSIFNYSPGLYYL